MKRKKQSRPEDKAGKVENEVKKKIVEWISKGSEKNKKKKIVTWKEK